MMQTLTKTELAWIYKALEHDAHSNAMIMVNTDADSVEHKLANLARENARSVMQKIHTVMNDGSKRIKID